MKAGLLSIGVNICRLIVALTFIFSGYVKAIDPLGTQYKINDYLQAAGLGGLLPGIATLSLSVLLMYCKRFAVAISTCLHGSDDRRHFLVVGG